MKTAGTFAPLMKWIGCGVLILGVALWLFLIVAGIPRVGRGGFTVAILCGCGLSVLLFAALMRFLSISVASTTNASTEKDIFSSTSSLESSVWRARVAVCYAALATLMAISLYAVGVPVAFIGFDFAKGINDFGFIIIFSGLVVGVVAMICGLFALVLSGITAVRHRRFKWLLAALAVAFFQVVALLVIRNLIH